MISPCFKNKFRFFNFTYTSPLKWSNFSLLFYSPLIYNLFPPLISLYHFSLASFWPPHIVQSLQFFSLIFKVREIISLTPHTYTRTNPRENRNQALSSSLQRITNVRKMHFDVKQIWMQTSREPDHQTLFEEGNQTVCLRYHQPEFIVIHV